jgi:ribosome-associated toxin RatA of RatAB toxin-antitoxin module
MAFPYSLKHLFLLSAILSAPVAPAHSQPDMPHHNVDVTVERMQNNDQSFFRVDASGFAAATQQQVWQVLTDYERLSSFVPDMSLSRLISRTGHEAIIEQNGKTGFLFIKRDVRLVMRVTEQPFSTIDIALIEGDMKHYAAQWKLAPSTRDGRSGTLITYSATMEPDFFVPPLISGPLVQANVEKTMEAVIAEIVMRY